MAVAGFASGGLGWKAVASAAEAGWIYWFHSASYPAVLLWAFAKNEASDMSAAQLAQARKAADSLRGAFGGEQ